MIAYGTTQFHVYSAASTVNKACRAKLQDIKVLIVLRLMIYILYTTIHQQG